MAERTRSLRTADTLEERLLLAVTVNPLSAQDAPQALVAALLAANPNLTVEAGSVSFKGANNQTALYSNFNFPIPASASQLADIGEGILLTTGNAALATSDFSSAAGAILNEPGDSQLSTLIAGVDTNDAASLEFDFTVPDGMRSIRLSLIFGSEEFPEFVGDSFNDVLGIYLDDVLIAFDDSNQPLTVNNNFFSLNNSGLNESQEPNVAGKTAVDFDDLQYDGLTRWLVADGNLNQQLQVHHLKIAIADANDFSYDSAAFLSGLAASEVLVEGGLSEGIDNDDDDPDSSTSGAEIVGVSISLNGFTATPPVNSLGPLNTDVPPFALGTTTGPTPTPPSGLAAIVANFDNPELALGSGGDSQNNPPQSAALEAPLRRAAADAALASFLDAGSRRVAVDQQIDLLLAELADAQAPPLLAIDEGDVVVQRDEEPAAKAAQAAMAKAVTAARPVTDDTSAQQERNTWSRWWLLGVIPLAGMAGKLLWNYRRQRAAESLVASATRSPRSGSHLDSTRGV